MSQAIPLFPMLSEDVKDDILKLDDYIFSYKRDNEVFKLTQDKDNTGLCIEAKLSDETGYWNPDEYPLYLNRIIKISNAVQLFSSDNPSIPMPHAIVCHDAVVGIGLKWYSAESNQCGAIPIGEITRNTSNRSFNICHFFDRASIRGEVFLKVILYVCKPGHPKNFETHYANTTGVVLGEIDTFAIRIDGNGSSFPIYEIEKPGEPLWDVKCTWTDATIDSFSDCVSIFINKAHKNYKYLNREDTKNFNYQLFSEIMSSAICVIVETLKEEDNGLTSLENAQEGSVAQAVNYFREKLGWNLKSSQLTSKSVRLFLEDKLKTL